MSGRDGSDWGGLLAVVGVAGFAGLCCAGPLLFGTVGVGAVVAAVTSWWLVIPFLLAAGGIIAWSAWRRSCSVTGVTSISESREFSRTEL